MLLRSEDIEGFGLIEQKVDMAILAVGLEPREDAAEIAGMLGITVDSNGWFNELNYVSDPVNTRSGGITVAGVCQGPKDIPDTVAQASAASASVLRSILKGKVKGNIKDLSLSDIEIKAKELSKIKEVES